MNSKRLKVLFIAEDITLAQVVRLSVLARSLDPRRYDVHFACANFDELVFNGLVCTRHRIFTLNRERVFASLERGQRLYDHDTLERYVEEELGLFKAVQPDVVVGDMRMSLTVSAPHFGVPYASLINAYWSKHMLRSEFPLPDHPIVNLVGERLAAKYFPKAFPHVLARFAEPVNKLRKRYGLAPVGDLIDVLLAGDLTLFPDVPEITPLEGAPPHHVFLGPVLWSPDVPAPELFRAPAQREFVYVTLGSSGRVDRLPVALEGLRELGLPLLVSTAGRCAPESLGPAVVASDFWPGSEAARRSQLVVCNGGSSTAYQALAEGTPVLGIASNLDQYLAMSAIQERGAGILLRGGSVTPAAVAHAARELIEAPRYRQAAERLQLALTSYDSSARFARALHRLAARPRPNRAPLTQRA